MRFLEEIIFSTQILYPETCLLLFDLFYCINKIYYLKHIIRVTFDEAQIK